MQKKLGSDEIEEMVSRGVGEVSARELTVGNLREKSMAHKLSSYP